MASAPDVVVPTPRGRRWLLAIVVATVLGRGVYGLYDYRAHGLETVGHYGDGLGYVIPAVNLVKTGRYAGDDGRPDIHRTPGTVPLLLPGILLHQIVPVSFVLQLFLGGLTVFLTWYLALRLTDSEAVALLAAGLVALEPGAAIYTSRIWSEMLFLTLIVAIYLLLFQSLRDGRTGTLAATGLVIGYAALVRPIAVALPIALVPFLLYGLLQLGQKPLPAAGRVLLLTILALAPSGAWYYRNVKVADFHGLTTVAGYNQYFFNAAGLEAYHNKESVWETKYRWGSRNWPGYLERHPQQEHWTEAQRAEWQFAEGSRLVRAEWPLAIWLQLKGIVTVLLSRYELGLAGNLTLLGNLLLMPLAFLGLFSPHWRARRSEKLIVLVCFLYLLVMSGGPAGISRFRIPLAPLIAISAAAALVWLVGCAGDRTSGGGEGTTRPEAGDPVG